jgi:GTPase SAR1 family protein
MVLHKIKIVGDAGTGKTTYLQSIMKRLRIRGFSHTRTAVRRLTCERAPAAKTIHSISLRLSMQDASFRKAYQKTKNFGGVESCRLRFCSMHGLKMHHDPYTPCNGKAFFSLYSYHINTGKIPDNANPELVELIQKYEEFKAREGFVDYEDFLLAGLAVAREKGLEINLVIDEAQDLSPLQWAFVDTIGRTAFIAGDELQSIFSFQGATPETFENCSSSTKILDYNYRIPENIWNIAGMVVEKQIRRKRAVPIHSGGSVLEICGSREEIAKLAAALAKNGRTLLLCRHNSTVVEYSHVLDAMNEDYTLVKLEQKTIEAPPSSGLLVDTIHTCKGLEAPFVILVDEPAERNEEEDRIRYVGMTRASAALIIANQVNGSKEPGYIRTHFDLPIPKVRLHDALSISVSQYRNVEAQKTQKNKNRAVADVQKASD